MVEFLRDVLRDFQVLLLVLADRNALGLEHQDVGGHQDRVREQAVVGDEPLGDLVLVGMAALEESHAGDVREDPGEFGDLRDVRLHPKGAAFGVETQGQEIRRGLEGLGPEFGAAALGGQSVVVDDEAEEVMVVLIADHALHHSEIIAEMELAGRLDAGKDPHTCLRKNPACLVTEL